MIPLLPDGSPDNLAMHNYQHVIDSDGRLCIRRVHDGAWLVGSRDKEVGEYGRYTRWVEKGNVPEEIDLRTDVGQKRFKECDVDASRYHTARALAHKEANKMADEQHAIEVASRSVNNG